jgi:hypothetical protein
MRPFVASGWIGRVGVEVRERHHALCCDAAEF